MWHHLCMHAKLPLVKPVIEDYVRINPDSKCFHDYVNLLDTLSYVQMILHWVGYSIH